ncbi:MAG: hypothetical protein ASARMPRED_005654 [Alectoria sarmentosa]|nr:MAG: hypothetical protein ASARMPRED_005654 [Alectoria sarmentosa]
MKHESAPKPVKAFDIDAKTSGIIPISEASRPRQLEATDPALLFIPRWKSFSSSTITPGASLDEMPTLNNSSNPIGFVTSTVGNGVSGVAKTAGGIVGAAGRGVGQTVTGVTGSAGKPVGDALEAVGNGVEGGAKSVGDGIEDAGKGKKGFWS